MVHSLFITGFNFLSDLIIPLVLGGGISGLVLFLGKNLIAKSIDHSFNKKIEDYKASLGKETISYQIEKAEFSKKKFEKITELYLQILEWKRLIEDCYSLMEVNNLPEVRSVYEQNQEFNRKMEENISVASLFLNDSLVKKINSYKVLSHFLVVDLVQIAENRILQTDTTQKIFLAQRVVQNDKYNEDEVVDHLNRTSKSLSENFKEITLEIKAFLAVD